MTVPTPTPPYPGGVGVRVPGPALPGSTRPRWRRMAPAVLLGTVVAGLTLALHVRDPHVEGSWGFCPTRLLFGIDCMACGGLRAVHHLSDGNLLEALSSNALVVAAAPVAVALWARRLVRTWQGGPAMTPLRVPVWLWTVGALVAAVFMVWRNTAAGAWFHS